MSIVEEKAALRAAMKNARAVLTAEYMQSSDKAILNQLSTLPEYKACDTLFCYCSIQNEIDTRTIISLALHEGKTVALPVPLPDGKMLFRAIRSPNELHPGVFGIPEPNGTCPEPVPKHGDLCVTPGLCFDMRLFRLGLGRGYYDRWLKANQVMKLGLCREKLMLDALPAEPFDVSMDIVVTEHRILRK